MGTHARLAPAIRAAIADRIDLLIEMLDADDAPLTDLEPEHDQCEAGDDGCGFVRLGGRSGWGSREEHGRQLPVPLYGVDQTTGPMIDRKAERDRRAGEMGLVRTATGWRWP
ncbi:hypothetical protein [Sphingomonas sp.]|uniref:hypothetical protein n=1 Tax=Sphingomonas sp. TaxID=28214 RepID=UPI003B0093BA